MTHRDRIIQLLTLSPTGATINEIASITGIAMANVMRITEGMILKGQAEEERYRIQLTPSA